jgi:AbrB family looped-hinge helix DNA binding protein
MSGTHTVTVGDRGRLVVPSALRERAGFEQGATLVLIETDSGVVMVSREQLRDLVRRDLSGSDLVAALLAERRTAAQADDR